MDIYEEALEKLRADERSLNVLEQVIGVPAETLRDIKRRIVTDPRMTTLRKIVAHYGGETESSLDQVPGGRAP
jgi:hypothetical protein